MHNLLCLEVIYFLYVNEKPLLIAYTWAYMILIRFIWFLQGKSKYRKTARKLLYLKAISYMLDVVKLYCG